MAFAIKARVLLELGAELISSDAIALYELIKNGIDAGSRRLEVNVNVTLPHSAYRRLHKQLESETPPKADELIESLRRSFERSAPETRRDEFIEEMEAARTTKQLRSALDLAYAKTSWISVEDWGDGMTLDDLNDVYLTIGTTKRLEQKDKLFRSWGDRSEDPPKIPMGEKGIGRLAAMRLGDQLEVVSSVEGEKRWNYLRVDWGFIKEDLNQALSDFPADTGRGEPKSPEEKGTTVTVRKLLADWSVERLGGLTRTEFARLYDPLTTAPRRDRIRFRFNAGSVDPTAFERELLAFADAYCTGEFRYDDGVPTLVGTVHYSLFKRDKTFKLSGIHLENILKTEAGRRKKKRRDEDDEPKVGFTNDELIDALETLGPFSWEFHWYNRGRLRKEAYELWDQRLGEFVRLWSGGLLVYRDGYRVYPYAAPEDDWLDLDRDALAASGYKLNRSQIIGKVNISSRLNPRLQDQTNREGFRDCPEKSAMVRMLRQVIITEARTFLEKVNDETRPVSKDDLDNIERRLESSHKEAVRKVKDIGRRVPSEQETINQLLDYLKDVTLAWEKAKDVAATFESDLERYLHLAGIGLMVEFIAHELTRATTSALETLDAKDLKAKGALSPTLMTLRSQLKTIEKRLRVLDPLSVPGRQRRSMTDVREVARNVLDSHAAQFERHHIALKFEEGSTDFVFKVEPGQIVQILENLISNSVYWLRERKIREPKFAPVISIRFTGRELRYSDNGPGIPEERGEDVFTPFITTKPPGKGRGLGLYIARKLAEYNDARLELDQADKDGFHKAFLLKF